MNKTPDWLDQHDRLRCICRYTVWISTVATTAFVNRACREFLQWFWRWLIIHICETWQIFTHTHTHTNAEFDVRLLQTLCVSHHSSSLRGSFIIAYVSVIKLQYKSSENTTMYLVHRSGFRPDMVIISLTTREKRQTTCIHSWTKIQISMPYTCYYVKHLYITTTSSLENTHSLTPWSRVLL